MITGGDKCTIWSKWLITGLCQDQGSRMVQQYSCHLYKMPHDKTYTLQCHTLTHANFPGCPYCVSALVSLLFVDRLIQT